MPLSGPGRATLGMSLGARPATRLTWASLKTLPCLETADNTPRPGCSMPSTRRRLLVSFPGRSLTGRRKGQAAHTKAVRALLDERGWAVQRFEFETESGFWWRRGRTRRNIFGGTQAGGGVVAPGAMGLRWKPPLGNNL